MSQSLYTGARLLDSLHSPLVKFGMAYGPKFAVNAAESVELYSKNCVAVVTLKVPIFPLESVLY